MRKTNAARILDSIGIEYEVREYEVDESDLSAETVAARIGLPLDQVFKTLVAVGDRSGALLAIIPGGAELNLDSVAHASGNKRVSMAPLKDVQPITGYLRGGVSPLGMKRQLPVYLDETAILYPFISISGGLRGMQLLLGCEDLVRATGAVLADLTSTD